MGFSIHAILWLSVAAAASSFLLVGGQEVNVTSHKRAGKALSVFQIVTFKNDPCSGGTKNGTCYTAEECSQRGGTNAGSCADGFGVCCTISLNCGQTSNENCTYFESSGITAGGCSAEICPCNDNICQMRLDFVTFVITGPSTISISNAEQSYGISVIDTTASTDVNDRGRCLTDTFSVSSGGITPPVLCGTNTGEHMYVDFNRGCINMAFTFGTAGVFASIPTRAFSIKATQYSCEHPNLAPQGCTQYFYGATTGNVQSYNYNSGNGQHLANQDQQICVSSSAQGYNNHENCCGYTSSVASGFDCVHIPGAQKATAPYTLTGSNFCGRDMGLVYSTGTGAGAPTSTAPKSVCSTQTPFLLAFRSDPWETVEGTEETVVNAGFTLGYTMDSINC